MADDIKNGDDLAIDPIDWLAMARIVDKALSEKICESWYHSDYRYYETFDDLPEDIKDACVQVAKDILSANTERDDSE